MILSFGISKGILPLGMLKLEINKIKLMNKELPILTIKINSLITNDTFQTNLHNQNYYVQLASLMCPTAGQRPPPLTSTISFHFLLLRSI